MSKQVVQCLGSGRAANVGFNVKRAMCPTCQKQVPVASNGRLRKHTRMLSKAQMRRGRS